MLLRQCAASGCLTDDVEETTYVCSSCGHAREPTYAKKASAGFEWDGGPHEPLFFARAMRTSAESFPLRRRACGHHPAGPGG